MTLHLADSWVWDFWLVDDGAEYHAFFLYASRALQDPDARHLRASVGHAVSTDLRSWTRVADALVHSDAPAFDDVATWTGSIVRHPDGRWFQFYTGTSMPGGRNVQTVGYATSDDLLTWTKNPANPVLRADERWHHRLVDGGWDHEAFRDPWVFADGDGWTMFVTARAVGARAGEGGGGIVARAHSTDLEHWEALPPLTTPGHGFEQLEVVQTFALDGQAFITFSCLAPELAGPRRETTATGGIWVAPGESLSGPFDLGAAQLLTDDSLYVGRVVAERETGRPLFLAFRHNAPDGSFVGDISDPFEIGVVGGVVRIEPSPVVNGAVG
ncbi:glycosyl hydrolase family 32 [Frondihabitans sp. 4ASC-45]|uniref:glycosyl hydrolase family 32 n=1 Tax=Frondihabitans sp. 4ASC-45 TaxID=3111636 RepID=UPI003C234477